MAVDESYAKMPGVVAAVVEPVVGGRHALYADMERRFNVPMLMLSVLLIPGLLLPMMWRGMPSRMRDTFDALDWLIWLAFVVEYVTLLAVSPERLRFVRTHLVELALVALPLLRPLRIARGLRLARLANLTRVGTGGLQVLRISRRHLAASAAMYAGAASVVGVVVSAALVTAAESSDPKANIKGFWDGLWWAANTITSIAYGDMYPVTVMGRIVAVVLMVLGVALLSVVTATMASVFVRWTAEPAEELEESEHAVEAAQLTVLLEKVITLQASIDVLSAQIASDRLRDPASVVDVTG